MRGRVSSEVCEQGFDLAAWQTHRLPAIHCLRPADDRFQAKVLEEEQAVTARADAF
jgi:hypothetical protein